MTTNESVIVSALNQRREFDIFQFVKPSRQFVASGSLQNEYVRVYLSAVEGLQTPSADISTSGVAGQVSVFAECTLLHLGQRIGPVVTTAHSKTNDFLLNEWVEFPVRYSELPLDAMIHCRIIGIRGLIGEVSLYPFTTRGELKTGPRRYPVVTDSADSAAREATTSYEVWELVAREKALGRVVDVPWLDALTQRRINDLTQRRRAPSTSTLTMSVEFPTTSNALPVFFTSIPKDHDADAWAYDTPPSIAHPFYDLDVGRENLSEQKAAVLSRSLYLTSDSDAQPGYKERKSIAAAIQRPLIQLDPMRVDDAALLWRFRTFLTKDAAAFLPFMSCVDWTNKGESQEADRLMPRWKSISLEDALVCLSYVFDGVHSVRKYAVERLNKEPTARLHTFALQLVQGARYDVDDELMNLLIHHSKLSWEFCCHVHWFIAVEVALEAANKSADGSNTKYTRARSEMLRVIGRDKPEFLARIEGQEQLKAALTNLHATVHKDHRADRTKKIEIAREILKHQRCGLKELFLESPTPSATLAAEGGAESTAPLGATLRSLIDVAGVFHTSDGAAAGGTATSSGLLSAPRMKTLTLPTHPSMVVDGITDQGFYMFKSAKMPMKINFYQHRPDSRASDADSVDIVAGSIQQAPPQSVAPKHASPPMFPLMFKCGDDVRQDQLVIQIIELMDRMLKDNGLDLCLTPYRVLATSPNDGFMELVPDVETFQSVQKDVVKYIASHNKTTEKFSNAMERFIKSCAGYCVITFILGIGDRHLENLLITSDGRLLHIDFGFIFGNDPKPFPPPMKICKEMVDAMGGPQSVQYSQFKTYCCSAYNILRKHYSVIMAAMLLMVDASIAQISAGSRRSAAAAPGPVLDPRVELLKVQDKFRLDLNNAEATQYIQNVIADSVGAIFTNLWDVIHIAAQAARN